MDNRRTLIVTGVIILIIFLLIIGVIWSLFNFFRNRDTVSEDIFPRVTEEATSSATFVPTPTPTAPAIPTAAPTTVPTAVPAPTVEAPAGTEVHSGQGFYLFYPQNWGLLTCSNSQNFELDPNSNVDSLNVVCDYAVKPVTVIVTQGVCTGGELVSLGGMQVRKSVDNNYVTTTGRGKQYKWCTVTNPGLEITHRVGTGRAFSANDHSVEIEQMISRTRFGGGS